MLLQTHQIVSVRYVNEQNEMRIIRKSTLYNALKKLDRKKRCELPFFNIKLC